jgi:hypothetical protein
MNVFQTDREGRFIATLLADESPLEPGVVLLPAGCVTIAPPQTGPEQFARWTGSAWEIVDVPQPMPQPPAPPAPPPVPASISRRQAAHIMLEIGMISAQEAVDMARMATIPPVLEVYISMLPDFMETEARIDFAANEYLRVSPILDILRAHMNYTAEQTDDAFRAAALK